MTAETPDARKEPASRPPEGGEPAPETAASSETACTLRPFSYSGDMTVDTVFTYGNLCAAARECLKGVQWKNGAAKWRMNLLGNCRKLEKEIAAGTYRMGSTGSFVITSPKRRTVSSILMRDRVVHKVLCRQGGLVEDMMRSAYRDNCACRTGKGTGFAMRSLTDQLAAFYRRHGASGWVLELDIHRFFDSIPHDRLIEYVYSRVRRPEVRRMTAEIIRHNGSDRGLELGSEVSQVLANAYLTPVDYVVKQKFGVQCFVRYADNIVAVVPDTVTVADPDGSPAVISGREFASVLYRGIAYAAGTLGLELNSKSSLHPLSQGLCFLGFHWRIGRRGKILRKLRRGSVTRMRRRVRRLAGLYRRGLRTGDQVRRSFESWAAYAGGGLPDRRIREMRRQLEEYLNANIHP